MRVSDPDERSRVQFKTKPEWPVSRMAPPVTVRRTKSADARPEPVLGPGPHTEGSPRRVAEPSRSSPPYNLGEAVSARDDREARSLRLTSRMQ